MHFLGKQGFEKEHQRYLSCPLFGCLRYLEGSVFDWVVITYGEQDLSRLDVGGLLSLGLVCLVKVRI